MWNGGTGQATDDDIIWRMCCACWVTKATNTHTICNTYCFSTATMVAGTRLNVTLHVGYSKINLRMDGKNKCIVIVPKRTLSSNK